MLTYIASGLRTDVLADVEVLFSRSPSSFVQDVGPKAKVLPFSLVKRKHWTHHKQCLRVPIRIKKEECGAFRTLCWVLQSHSTCGCILSNWMMTELGRVWRTNILPTMPSLITSSKGTIFHMSHVSLRGGSFIHTSTIIISGMAEQLVAYETKSDKFDVLQEVEPPILKSLDISESNSVSIYGQSWCKQIGPLFVQVRTRIEFASEPPRIAILKWSIVWDW